VGFEHIISEFERAKTVHALECAATVTDNSNNNNNNNDDDDENNNNNNNERVGLRQRQEFSPLHSVQTGSEAHPASCPMVRDGKVAGT
jgi:hypothetical protein